jgi:hypothetical protein
MTQVVERLPSLCTALVSIPSTTRKKKNIYIYIYISYKTTPNKIINTTKDQQDSTQRSMDIQETKIPKTT